MADMKPCIYLDYEEHFAGCVLCTAAPHFPTVRYWERQGSAVPYAGAPIKVQFCKQRGRINNVFSCYNGEEHCYTPAEDAPQNAVEENGHIAQHAEPNMSKPTSGESA